MLADDLFAGAGGWDLAASALGIHARGVENMPEARATRDAAGLTTIHDDVWTFKPRYLGRQLTASGLIASPPCQTFSTAGKGAGRKALNVIRQLAPHVGGYTLKQLRRIATRATGDERTALVLTPLWFALHHPYEWLAWEQVGSVLPVWEICAEVLREQGWHVWTGRLFSEQYGVPQTRGGPSGRAFLLASRGGPVGPPTPTHSRYYSHDPGRLDLGVEKWVSMAEALGWGLGTRPAPTNWRAEPTPAIEGETAADCDWVNDRPSPTVVGSFAPDVVAAPGYRKAGDPPRQKTPGSVRVTVAEAGILQSFPADHPWQGTKGKQYLQCGNAVPPLLAWHALGAAAVHHLAIDEDQAS